MGWLKSSPHLYDECALQTFYHHGTLGPGIGIISSCSNKISFHDSYVLKDLKDCGTCQCKFLWCLWCFSGVSFSGISFSGVSFSSVSFSGVSFSGVSFSGVSCYLKS